MSKIKLRELELWDKITFKTTTFSKNSDFLLDNEQFISEHDGEVFKINFDDNKPAKLIGEFGLSIWNITLSNYLNVDLLPLIKTYSKDVDSYSELLKIIENNEFDLSSCKKLIVIQYFVLNDEHRKNKITEEFFEYIFRNFYDDTNTKILCLVKPLQYNEMDYDYFFNIKTIIDKTNNKKIPAKNFFGLNKYLEKKDRELNEYKLFSVASKCGLKRIGESYLFELKPKKILKRIEEKHLMLSDVT
ncbi:MAG: hypothetical protein ACOC33_00965 [bacterium]